ncbi:allantoate deiminase [Paenibacillus sp. HJL G12]|uniref:Allantoate deiminase n=1 Tax=Paenibacillus dendrobii TaxID=2691084 RepID=A0A7X3IM31_9BACL|nr:allantoate deiminase [Paenibacillus dendrobii]MWV46473.1 allantoate deiminase [Paenibacillus dendrobii]
MQMTEELIQWLGTIGSDSDGGVTRLLYTPSWKEAQEALAAKMESLGLQAYFDDAGNLCGRLQGTDADCSCILTGSHVDTVQRGGKYDGAYGIVAGITALSRLRERYGAPKKSIEVVAFCEEEGSRFPYNYWGSTFMTGAATYQDIEQARDQKGIPFMTAMEEAGFGPGTHGRGLREDIETFIELHVEQGAILEQEQQSIGIVEQIVGLQRYTVRVQGEANHAGTTPMVYRKDAIRTASEMVIAIMNKTEEMGAPLVATVGQMELIPNTPNVIPGQVNFTIDVRHPDGSVLDGACQQLVDTVRSIATQQGREVGIERWMNVAPIAMDSALTDAIEDICQQQELSYRRMPSGAGHDAQIFASYCRTAMVFVPSRGGISHSPLEYTEPQQLEDGVRVLTDLLYKLAY